MIANTNPKVDEAIEKLARAALSDGIEINDEAGGPVHYWVLRNVKCSPGAIGAIVMLTAWRMADIKAQEAGYKNAVDEAMSKAESKLNRWREMRNEKQHRPTH